MRDRTRPRGHRGGEELPATYVADLPEEDWADIRGFVLAETAAALPRLSYAPAVILGAVAHHVDWCVNVAGLPMSREAVFRRDVIGAAAAVMPTTHSSSRGRRRSLLLRVGEALDVIPTPAPLPPLSAASPSAPYGGPEVEEVVRWSLTQEGTGGRSARALVALGLGAGLPTRELAAIRASDVIEDGGVLRVGGESSRAINLCDPWAEELALLSSLAEDQDAPLFRPGVAWQKNIVTNFVANSIGAGIRPTTSRLRSTWLVQLLATGTPMQDLLSAAGLQSMDALVRYERFLPAPSPAPLPGTTR